MLTKTLSQGQKLRAYTGIVLRWMWFLILCTLAGGGIAYGASHLQTPVYRATALLIVDQQTSSDAYSNLLASNELVSTYLSLIKTPPVMKQAADAVGGISEKDLTAATNVSNPGVSTQIIQIQVDDTSPDRAAALANAVGSAFIVIQQQTADAGYTQTQQQIAQQIADANTKISTFMAQIAAARAANPNDPQIQQLQSQLDAATAQRDSLELVAAQQATQHIASSNSLRIYQAASAPTAPDHPKPLQTGALGALAGLVLAGGIVILNELLNDRLRTGRDIREATDLPMLGALPSLHGRQLVLKSTKGRLKDAMRLLRTNLNFASLGEPVRVVVVTSSVEGEGKTTVAVNLALSLAQTGRRVVLVDADLRLPRVHKLLQIPNTYGLSLQVLAPSQLAEFERVPFAPSLLILPAGPPPPNPTELVRSEQFKGLLQWMLVPEAEGGGGADVIVLDTPPAAAYPDAVVLAAVADSTIIVVDRTKARFAPVRRMLDALRQVDAHIAGVVINRAPRQRDSFYYSGEMYLDKERETAIVPVSARSPARPVSMSAAASLREPTDSD